MIEASLNKKQKIKKIIAVVGAVTMIIILILWAVKTINTNKLKIDASEKYYEMGEEVDIGDCFFTDAREKMQGYSVKVNSAELVDYEEILKKYGQTINLDNFNENYPAPKYAYLLNMTIKNTDNKDSGVFVLPYALYNKSLQIPVDFDLWGYMDENFTGEPGLRLVENTEVTITIPFTPMPLNTGVDHEELEKRMENEPFYLCVSNFPERKLIEVHL